MVPFIYFLAVPHAEVWAALPQLNIKNTSVTKSIYSLLTKVTFHSQ